MFSFFFCVIKMDCNFNFAFTRNVQKLSMLVIFSCSIPRNPYLKYRIFKVLTYLEDILANNRIGNNYFNSQVKGVWHHIGQSIGGLESSEG